MTELTWGGTWHPKSCIPRSRVAIIVPFRDREEHLRVFLSILHPMLQRQMIHYTIFVIEQVGTSVQIWFLPYYLYYEDNEDNFMGLYTHGISDAFL